MPVSGVSQTRSRPRTRVITKQKIPKKKMQKKRVNTTSVGKKPKLKRGREEGIEKGVDGRGGGKMRRGA